MALNPEIVGELLTDKAPEQFSDGEYEVPVFLHEDGKEQIIGVGVIEIDDGELSATIDIDHKVFMDLGFELKFQETNFPFEGRKYSLHARKKKED